MRAIARAKSNIFNKVTHSYIKKDGENGLCENSQIYLRLTVSVGV